jgi:predicted AlkP superfamily pyrophosphatase or phosphodiesterase
MSRLRYCIVIVVLFVILLSQTGPCIAKARGDDYPRFLSKSEVHEVHADVVILLGIDGLPSLAIDNEEADRKLPNFLRLLKQGSYAPCARNMAPTVSTPNWAAMLHGNEPMVLGITTNTESQNYAPAYETARLSIFDRIWLESNGTAALASFYSWCAFESLLSAFFGDSKPTAKPPSWLVNRQPPEIVHACRSVDLLTVGSTLKWLTELKEHFATSPTSKIPAFAAIHLNDLDAVGHRAGWFSPEFYRHLESMDLLVGWITDALNEFAAVNRTAVLVLTSDHGGWGTGHSDPHLPEVVSVPLILWSSNASVFRPDFPLLEPAVTNVDVFSTVLRMFGLWRESLDSRVYRSRPLDSAFQFANVTVVSEVFKEFWAPPNVKNGHRFCHLYDPKWESDA